MKHIALSLLLARRGILDFYHFARTFPGATVRAAHTQEDHVTWDRFVMNFPGAHYFQTYGWLKSYGPMGLTPHVLLYEADGVIAGGVAFLSVNIPLLPWSILIIPHGPLPANPDMPGWVSLMQCLDELCRDQNVIYAQLYPHEPSEESVILPRLEELGFTSPAMFTSHQFSSSLLKIDLQGKTEGDNLSSVRERTRTYIRRALSSNLVLRTEVDPPIFKDIYALFLENGELMGYRPRPFASLRAAWEWFAPKGLATLIQAWHDKTLVGAILLVFAGRTAYYVAGAVKRGFAECRPAEFMHWHGIRTAIEHRLDAYDLGNITSDGVYQFKRGFRPQYQSWHAPRTKLYRPWLSRMVSGTERYFRPRLRSLAHWRAH
jgi:hypothetical protein